MANEIMSDPELVFDSKDSIDIERGLREGWIGIDHGRPPPNRAQRRAMARRMRSDTKRI